MTRTKLTILAAPGGSRRRVGGAAHGAAGWRSTLLAAVTACALALPGLAAGQGITGLAVNKNPANSADAFQNIGGLTFTGFQRQSVTSVVGSSPSGFETRYAWANAADSDLANTDTTSTMTSDYTVGFNVTVPGAYDLLVTTTRNAGFNHVDDGSGNATASMSAITGGQTGGTLSGSLGFAAAASLSSAGGGSSSINATTAVATISGTSNGSPVAHTLSFAWTSTCVSNSTSLFGGGDACGQRGGLPVNIAGLGNAGYAGAPARTQTDDGHFVEVTLVSYCGNGTTEAGKGEQCDEGPANGTSTSCCTATCQLRTAGEQCRGNAGLCDNPETCDGVAPTCPTDAFKMAGVSCRAASPGEACDVEDFCDGLGPNCADDVEPAGTVCRSAAGDCDQQETCDGSSTSCPADAKSTAICRASAGVCDIAEQCDGVNDDCAADAVEPASTVCRAVAGSCDIAEQCDGSGVDCPADVLVSAGTECRAVADVCDVAEQCDGANADCPTDAFEPASTVCRAVSVGEVCDVEETCTGSGAACPADAVEPAGTECRAQQGVCDVAEQCDGSSKLCPTDAKEPPTTVCRASSVGEVCDIPDFCDGSTDDCPADAVEPPTTVCRAASSGELCDVSEFCDGSNRTCPPDAVASNTTVCRVAADACDLAELCDGSGKLCPGDAVASTGTVCRPDTGACDVAETCDGVAITCPADGFEADGASCADGTYCNGAETCQSGSCQSGTNPCMMGENCDEGSDQCFTGICPPSASNTCLTAQKAKLLIKNNLSDDAKDKLVWKWLKGAATMQADFANPTTTADYALCVYAGAGGALAGSAEVPASNTKWSAISTKGYKYKDVGGTEDGITKALVKSGTAGKSKALVKGKGNNLPDFALPFSNDPVTVQLRNHGNGTCLTSTFDAPKKSLDTQYNAKEP